MMSSFERSSGIRRILAYYLVLATLWILLSDRALEVIPLDRVTLSAVQSSKGLAFVFITTVGLALILRKEHHRTQIANVSAQESELRIQRLIDSSLARAEDHLRAVQLKARQAPFDLDLVSNEIVLGEDALHVLGLNDKARYFDRAGWIDHMHPADRPHIEDRLSGFLADLEEVVSLHYRHRTSEGEYLWILTRARIVKHPDGTPWRLLGTHTEVTHEKHLESTLSQRDATLRLFIDHAPAAIALFDREMRYLSASQRWMVDYRLTSDVIGRSHYEEFPYLPPSWYEAHRRAMSGEVIRNQEDCFINQDGEEQWLSWEVRPWFAPDGTVGGIAIFTENITERKRLLDHLSLYSSVFTRAHEAITITDRKVRILDVNDAFSTITGYTREEVLGENPRILQSGKQDKAFYDQMWGELKENGQWYGEIWNRRKDGQVYPEFLTISTVRDDQGEVTNYVAHFFDLSKEKHIEQILKSTEESLASITSSMQDIVFTLDKDQRHTGVYGPWVEKAGLTPDSFLGKTTEEVLGKIEAQPHIEANRRALTGQFTVYEWTAIDGSGTRYFQTSLSPMRDDGGDVLGIVGVGRDITDLKLAEQRTQTQLERLSALRTVDTAISGTFDLSMTLKLILGQVVEQLDVQAASVLLLNPHSQTLAYAASKGFRTSAIERSRLRLGEGVAGAALLDGRRVRQCDPLHSLYFNRAELFVDESFKDYYAVPMVAKGRMIGVLEVFLTRDQEPTGDWLEFLDTLTDLAAIAVDNARLFGEVQRSHLDVVLAYDATIEGWSKALDLRDKETEGHTQRVAELTERLARMAGVSDADLIQMRRGALLHDIGKMGVPDSILLKEGPLTDEERKIIQAHPDLAYQMLSPIEFLRPALDIPYSHHEKWDGTGYPRRLRGEEIPLAARLFAVIDVWDALRSDRPYRKAWPRSRVLDHIRELSGSHFDPKSVELFLRMMEEDGEEIETVLGYINFAA